MVYKFDHISRANNEIIGALAHSHECLLRTEDACRVLNTENACLVKEVFQMNSKLDAVNNKLTELSTTSANFLDTSSTSTSPAKKRKSRPDRSPSRSLSPSINKSNSVEVVSPEMLDVEDGEIDQHYMPGSSSSSTVNIVHDAFDAMRSGNVRKAYFISDWKVTIEEALPHLFESNWSYTIEKSIHRNRKCEMNKAIEYIYGFVTIEERRLMQQIPSKAASQPEERRQWTENKKIACNAILKRFKESYNNGSTRALTYTLSSIATSASKMNKCQEKET